jgi:hypothetical protein
MRQSSEHRTKQNNMDILTIIAATLAAIGVIGLAWLGGYELGESNGISAQREIADRRVEAVLKKVNQRKPRTGRTRK